MSKKFIVYVLDSVSSEVKSFRYAKVDEADAAAKEARSIRSDRSKYLITVCHDECGEIRVDETSQRSPHERRPADEVLEVDVDQQPSYAERDGDENERHDAGTRLDPTFRRAGSGPEFVDRDETYTGLPVRQRTAGFSSAPHPP